MPLMMFLIEETRCGAGQPISQDNFYFAKETKAPHLKSNIVGRGRNIPTPHLSLPSAANCNLCDTKMRMVANHRIGIDATSRNAGECLAECLLPGRQSCGKAAQWKPVWWWNRG